MGIAKGPAILLMKEAARQPFNGSLLTLGKQTLLLSRYQLKRYAKKAGFPLDIPPSSDIYAPLLDRDFFSMLGFNRIDSLDYSNFEGATIQFDLNSGETPEQYREAFDVIYDGGTIEHVFHLPNVLKSLVWMLKPGGRLIHLSPASNHLEHSFYMFSPTFFYDFYKTNGFEVNYIQLVRCTPCFDYNYKVYNYTHGGCWANTDVGMGRLDTGMYLVHTVVTKTDRSTSHLIPNQSIYASQLWQQSNESRPAKKRLFSADFRNKCKQMFKASLIYPLWAFCKLKLRKQRMPVKPTDKF